jgi:hypothetical protein
MQVMDGGRVDLAAILQGFRDGRPVGELGAATATMDRRSEKDKGRPARAAFAPFFEESDGCGDSPPPMPTFASSRDLTLLKPVINAVQVAMKIAG